MSILTELFEKQGYDVSDRRIQRCMLELAWIFILAMTDAASPRLAPEDRQELAHLTEIKQTDAALRLIQAKYTSEEWNALIQKILSPLVEDYQKKVLEPGS